jgi:hypothetical protein
VSFTLDRYGHLYPEADRALRDRLNRFHEALAMPSRARVDQMWTRDRERRRLDGRDALTCRVGWWACQNLNLGPHPYQRSAVERRAGPAFLLVVLLHKSYKDGVNHGPCALAQPKVWARERERNGWGGDGHRLPIHYCSSFSRSCRTRCLSRRSVADRPPAGWADLRHLPRFEGPYATG